MPKWRWCNTRAAQIARTRHSIAYVTMPTKNVSKDQPFEDTAPARARDLVEGARDIKASISNVAQTASQRLEDGRSTAAAGLDSAASTVHERADDLPGGERVRAVARAAADGLSTTAEYVRSHDFNRLKTDFETLVKNNPGPALLAAAAFGFLLSRSLARD
jgi:hypothetical protein